MTRSYLRLAGLIAVLALALALVGRPRRPDATPAATDARAPIVELAITIGTDGIAPAVAAVPKGSRVRLTVENRGAGPSRLALAGYQDRLAPPPLAPGAVWTGEFLADRPGEDFAWLLDGEPAGRLSVTGSHLVEGHR
jgi:hypothetical protein